MPPILRTKSVDPEAVTMRWLRGLFRGLASPPHIPCNCKDKNEDDEYTCDDTRCEAFRILRDIPVRRSLNIGAPQKVPDIITVARTGSGGSISESGLLWEWELTISVWSHMTTELSNTDRFDAPWGRCAEVVDIICDELSLMDESTVNGARLMLGEDQNYEDAFDPDDPTNSDNNPTDYPYLIYARMVGVPRRRTQFKKGWARIDFEVMVTMGRDN